MLRGERRFVSVFATVNVPRSSSPFVVPVHQIVPDCLGLLTTLAHRRRLVTLTSLAWTKTAPSATHDLSVRRTRSTALPPGSSTSTRNATRRSSSANCWRPRRSKRGRETRTMGRDGDRERSRDREWDRGKDRGARGRSRSRSPHRRERRDSRERRDPPRLDEFGREIRDDRGRNDNRGRDRDRGGGGHRDSNPHPREEAEEFLDSVKSQLQVSQPQTIIRCCLSFLSVL